MTDYKVIIIPFILLGISTGLMFTALMTTDFNTYEGSHEPVKWRDMVDDLNEYGGKIHYLSYASGKAVITTMTLDKNSVKDLGDGILLKRCYYVPYDCVLQITIGTSTQNS